MELEVPFLSNTEDDTHCVQASLGMILKYFNHEKEYSWEELEAITAKDDNLWTWPLATLLWLTENGYEVKVIDLFDYEEFASKGAKYIYETLGDEIGHAQERNSDILTEQARAKQLKERVDKKIAIPTTDDLKQFLNNGYVPLCRVNSRVLNGREGYVGHSIIVKGYDDENLIINDPGLPPLEGREVSYSDFEKAWAYPTPKAKNITAVRLNNI